MPSKKPVLTAYTTAEVTDSSNPEPPDPTLVWGVDLAASPDSEWEVDGSGNLWQVS